MRHLVAIVAVGALFFAACSGPAADDSGIRSRLGGDDKKGAAQGKAGSKAAIKRAKKIAKRSGVAGNPAGSKRAAGEEPGGSKALSSEIDPALANKSAHVDDAPNDAKKEGITPGYAEIIAASITGLGKDFRMTLRLNATVPDSMPNDKTYWIIAFGITGPEESEGYSFGAQCTPEGWKAYAGGKEGGDGGFPGTFKVEGDEIHMTVPWKYIRGPREFEWYAASNWFAQIANTTHYSVDLAPNEGLAKFPN